MNEDRLIKATKGVLLFVAFILMGVSIPDVNALTLSYLQNLGISPRVFQFLFFISAMANLVIGLRGYRWNALWFAVWITYSVAALAGYLSGSNTPLLAVCAYLLLSTFLTIDVLQDAELFEYIGKKITWKKEVL